MSYRNKTYVIFDGDNDMWAYAYMKGWNTSEHIDFDFVDAHEVNEIRNGTQEENVKRKLRERLANTKQAIVLVGEKTKNLFRYVRWEIEVCLEKGIPIVAVNLNGKRSIDRDLCPPILDDKGALHVAFKAKIIKKALDEWAPSSTEKKSGTNYYYNDDAYRALGL
jgi:hypothetical protein